MPKVTQAHRDARRRQILDAARSVFAEKGFAQTSMGDIVARSGLSTGAVYGYFDSKADLIAAVCDDAMNTVVGDVVPGRLDELPDLIRHRDRAPEHARLMAQVWGEAAVSSPLAERVRARLAAGGAKLADLIRQERSTRGLPDTPDAGERAQTLLALMSGYSLRLAIGDEVDATAFRRAIQALIETP